MSFTFYTVGLLEEVSFNSGFVQVINSAYARTAPYYAINQGVNASILRHDFPEQTAEVWLSQCMYIASPVNTSNNAIPLALRKLDGTTTLAYLSIDQQTLVATAYVNGVARGSFAMTTLTVTQIEMRLKKDSAAGVFQVWKNGELVVDFTGDTGPATDLIGSAYWYSGSSGNILTFSLSDIVITSDGRIGNKRPVIVALTGAGDASPPAYYDIVGNQVTTTYSNRTVGRTYVLANVFTHAGTIKNITVNFNTTGTIYLGVCTRNQGAPAKHTKRLVSNQLAISATGIKTFVAGVDFPDNWLVSAGECLAIYTETAQMKYGRNSAGPDNNGYNSDGTYYFAGNGLADSVERTYTADSATYFDCIYAQYLVADPSRAYSQSAAADRLARKDFLETVRYAEFVSDNDQMLCALGDLPLICTGVKSVKVTARAVSGTSLPNADWILKIGSDNLGVQAAIPTTMALKSIQFDGNWTPTQFNAAQIGFKARA